MIITANWIKEMSIKWQQEPKQFHGCQYEPMKLSLKIVSFASLCLSLFNLWTGLGPEWHALSFGWKQVLSTAANVLDGWRSTCFSLQGRFEVDCSGVGVLSSGLPSTNEGSLVALSLVMCVSLELSAEATAPTGGEVSPAGGVKSLWLLGLRCSLVLWKIFLWCPPCRSGGALWAAACLALLLVARFSSRHSRQTLVPSF